MDKPRAGRWKRYAIPVAVLMAAAGGVSASARIRYLEETIRVRVHPRSIEVTGEYIYENSWPIASGIVLDIPVPVDADHPAPRAMTAAYGTDTLHPVRLFQILGHTFVLLWFSPHARQRFEVYYEQKTRVTNGCYLITTTQSWGRPLEKVRFRIEADGVRIVESSYPLEPCGDGVQGFERTAFMPVYDWTFAWEAL